MSKSIRFIGMDVHKNSIAIAIAEEGRHGEVRHYGTIDNKMTALDKVIRKLLSDNCELFFTYEAEPCGYGIYRQQIQQLLSSWRLFPVAKALQALRGVSLIVAATTVAESGDLRRFKNPSSLMAYLGLVPSEHSSGETTRRGRITKTGNGHVRRVSVEAAWSYRHQARITRHLLKRQHGLPSNIREISWRAQLRLCSRYRHMFAGNKTKQLIVTAIARELSAFMWAIAQKVPLEI